MQVVEEMCVPQCLHELVREVTIAKHKIVLEGIQMIEESELVEEYVK